MTIGNALRSATCQPKAAASRQCALRKRVGYLAQIAYAWIA